MIKPLVETYIASLPATGAHETWRDLGITPPPGVVDKTVEKGLAPKSEVAIVFSGPFEYDDATKLAFQTGTLLLQSRLNDAIREELGGTYNITANSETSKYPKPEYRIHIDWTCDPARTATLVQRVMHEIAFVRSTLLSPEQISRVRGILVREFERNSEENGYWLGQIARRYEDGEAANVGAVVQLPQQIARLSGEAVQRAAQRYLTLDRYVRVTLMPEKK